MRAPAWLWGHLYDHGGTCGVVGTLAPWPLGQLWCLLSIPGHQDFPSHGLGDTEALETPTHGHEGVMEL